MSPVPAPAPARGRPRAGAARPRPRPATHPATRPRLRVVDPADRPRHRRRRRARVLAAAAVTVAVGSLFALAAFHAMLASGQVRLDRLEGQVAEERARYQALRLEVARLEAPDRIVRVAQERLGMVPPPGVTYLSPSGAVADDVAGATDVPAPEPDRGGQAPWATVKPYLGGRR